MFTLFSDCFVEESVRKEWKQWASRFFQKSENTQNSEHSSVVSMILS